MARKPGKGKTKISLRDFKQWLAGVEDMQPEDWTPTRDQWLRIREQIDQIKEVVEVVEDTPAPANVPVARQPAHPQVQTLPAIQPDQSSALERGRPAPMVAPTANPAMVTPESGGTAKTPDIDTSGGDGYRSGFQ
jgi:hypothetical protein